MHPALKKRKRGGAIEGAPAYPRRLDRPGKTALLPTSASDPGVVERKAGGGIHIKPSHAGALHKQMGIAADKPIPTKALEREKRDAGPAEKKRIVFAEDARKWNHG